MTIPQTLDQCEGSYGHISNRETSRRSGKGVSAPYNFPASSFDKSLAAPCHVSTRRLLLSRCFPHTYTMPVEVRIQSLTGAEEPWRLELIPNGTETTEELRRLIESYCREDYWPEQKKK